MKTPNIDWIYLKKTMVVLFVAMAVSIIPLGITLYKLHSAQDVNKQLISQKDQINQEYIKVVEDGMLIRQYYQRYEKLVAAGVAGDENRLDWVSVVRDSAEKMKISSIRYEISAQEPFEASYLSNVGELTVYASHMLLKLQLAHEEEILRLIDDLNRNARGLFHVDSCEFTRAGEGVALHMERANIGGKCEFTWFTIRKPNPMDEEAA